jgi:nucleoid DNA-binding protein
MYRELYQYFIQHKNLEVPGIGTFLLQKRSAAVNFPDKQIDPPVYEIEFKSGDHSPANNFFTWLSQAMNISNREAVVKFNDFVFDLKKRILNGDAIEWKGMGSLSKGLLNDIKFIPVKKDIIIESPVGAQKIIREKPEHTVRVGEQQKTAAEMTEMLAKDTDRRDLWWAYALIIGLLCFVFIGWYLSEHGLDVSSTANQQKLVPKQEQPSHTELH